MDAAARLLAEYARGVAARQAQRLGEFIERKFVGVVSLHPAHNPRRDRLLPGNTWLGQRGEKTHYLHHQKGNLTGGDLPAVIQPVKLRQNSLHERAVFAEVVNLCRRIAGGKRGKLGLMARKPPHNAFNHRLFNMHRGAVVGIFLAVVALDFVQAKRWKNKHASRASGVVLVIYHHNAIAAGDIEEFHALVPVIVRRAG